MKVEFNFHEKEKKTIFYFHLFFFSKIIERSFFCVWLSNFVSAMCTIYTILFRLGNHDICQYEIVCIIYFLMLRQENLELCLWKLKWRYTYYMIYHETCKNWTTLRTTFVFGLDRCSVSYIWYTVKPVKSKLS